MRKAFGGGVISTPPHGISQDGKCHGTGRVNGIFNKTVISNNQILLKNDYRDPSIDNVLYNVIFDNRMANDAIGAVMSGLMMFIII